MPADRRPEGSRRPGMLKGDQTVNVAAKHLVYDASTSQATYTERSPPVAG